MLELWALDEDSARALVRQAEANGTLRFTDGSVERILQLTHCHPYLTQLLCQRIWERAYAAKPESAPQIYEADVDAAVTDALGMGRAALEQAQVRANEAVFVDDFPENVEASRRLGMIGIHFKDAASAIQQVKALL